jgi:hypothetical protein
MVYSLKYRLKSRFLWKTVKGIKGDLVPDDLPGIRVIILNDNSRLEIPIEGTEFLFCPNRFLAIHQQMERETGQAVPVR